MKVASAKRRNKKEAGVLRRKWEKLTGVPNEVVASTYLDVYRKKEGALSVDELKASDEHKAEFRKLLGAEYKDADLTALGNQLESLRKTGSIKLGTGKAKASRGYKLKVLEALKDVMVEAEVEDSKQEWVIQQLKGATQDGLTPSQVRILHVLSKSARGLTRAQLAKKAELSASLLTNLGNPYEDMDSDSGRTLIARKLATARQEDENGKDVIYFCITPAGRKALD